MLLVLCCVLVMMAIINDLDYLSSLPRLLVLNLLTLLKSFYLLFVKEVGG